MSRLAWSAAARLIDGVLTLAILIADRLEERRKRKRARATRRRGEQG